LKWPGKSFPMKQTNSVFLHLETLLLTMINASPRNGFHFQEFPMYPHSAWLVHHTLSKICLMPNHANGNPKPNIPLCARTIIRLRCRQITSNSLFSHWQHCHS
jgi:hypothetical protein